MQSIKYQLNKSVLPGLGAETEIDVLLDGLEKGYQKITATACDDVGNCSDAEVNFNLAD